MSLQEKSIVITNFPESVTESDIYKVLEGMKEEIDEVKVVNSEIAFVTFKNEEDIEQAYLYDGAEIGHQEISIDTINSGVSQKFEEYVSHYGQKQERKEEERQLQKIRQEQLEEKLKQESLRQLSQSLKEEDEKQLQEMINNDKQQQQEEDIVVVQEEVVEQTPKKDINIKMNNETFKRMTDSQKIEFESMIQNNENNNNNSVSKPENFENLVQQQQTESKVVSQSEVKSEELNLEQQTQIEQNPVVEQPKPQQENEISVEQETKVEQNEEEVEKEKSGNKEEIVVKKQQIDEPISSEKSIEVEKVQKIDQQEKKNVQQKETSKIEKEQQIETKKPEQKIQQQEQEKEKVKQQQQEKEKPLETQRNSYDSFLNPQNTVGKEEKIPQEKYEYNFKLKNISLIFGILFLIFWFLACQFLYKVFDLERTVSDQQSQINILFNMISGNSTAAATEINSNSGDL